MCQCEWDRLFKKKKMKTCLTFMTKLNGFYHCTFSIVFTTIMTFSSWAHIKWLLLVCQASTLLLPPPQWCQVLYRLSNTSYFLTLLYLSTCGHSVWNASPSLLKEFLLLWTFTFISSASVTLSPSSPGSLGCSFVPIVYASCISAVKQLYIVLIYIPASCWIVNSLKAEIEFLCVRNWPDFPSIHIHLSLFTHSPSPLFMYISGGLKIWLVTEA